MEFCDDRAHGWRREPRQGGPATLSGRAGYEEAKGRQLRWLR